MNGPTLYTCRSCGRTGRWTDGQSKAAGDPVDEYWCQMCGEEQPLPAPEPTVLLELAEAVHGVVTVWEARRHAFGAPLSAEELRTLQIGEPLEKTLTRLTEVFTRLINAALDDVGAEDGAVKPPD